MGSAIWSILRERREAASRGPSALADILLLLRKFAGISAYKNRAKNIKFKFVIVG